ncbi:MAG: DUF5678 domain-containing protein [Planctomycetota bacterium]
MVDSDFAWLVEHSPELFEQYRGRWITVRDAEVVGVGDTAPEAAEKARARVPDGDFILEAVDHEADVIYGVV